MAATHEPKPSMDGIQANHGPGHGKDNRQYLKLGLELAADFVVMFLVMYAMIATLDHFYLNISNVYMTMMMVAPMTLLMLIFMRGMYPSKPRNRIVIALAILAFATGWFGMRTQLGVDDAQLVRSMIPHHSGAILMCREAKLSDPEIKKLCDDIIQAQEKEIGQMKRALERL